MVPTKGWFSHKQQAQAQKDAARLYIVLFVRGKYSSQKAPSTCYRGANVGLSLCAGDYQPKLAFCCCELLCLWLRGMRADFLTKVYLFSYVKVERRIA